MASAKSQSLTTFYSSPEWRKLREQVILERTGSDGYVRDEMTGEPITAGYDIVLHHKIPLNDANVKDPSISLNPSKLMIVSHRSHNIIHARTGYIRRQVYLVYGPPLAGKTTYARSVMDEGDLILDLDDIWVCVSGQGRYVRPQQLKPVVFAIRDAMLDAVRRRLGTWHNAYIIGGYPLISDRERMAATYGAREVPVICDEQTCLARLDADPARPTAEWREYIRAWFRQAHTPPGVPLNPWGRGTVEG